MISMVNCSKEFIFSMSSGADMFSSLAHYNSVSPSPALHSLQEEEVQITEQVLTGHSVPA